MTLSLTDSLTDRTLLIDIQKTILWALYISDIWSEWWGDMTWPKKSYLPTQYPPTYLPTYVPPLENTLKEQSQRLVTFKTFDQSDEKTWPIQKKVGTCRSEIYRAQRIFQWFFVEHIKIAKKSKIWVPAPSEISLSRICSPKITVFRAFLGRKCSLTVHFCSHSVEMEWNGIDC